MATYVPNAETVTEPVASREVGSAAEEFRALKTYLQAELDADADEIGRLQTQTLRVPGIETVSALPPASQRADTQLLFDSAGEPYCGAPVSGSAADVMLQYASTASGKGAALVGVQDAAGDWSGLNQEEVNAEIGFLLIRSGAPVNALRAFSAAERAAIIAKTSTTDHQTQLEDLLGNNKAVHFPFGRYNGSAAITVTDRLQLSGHRFAELKFTDGAYTAIRFTGGSAALSTVENLWIVGSNTTGPLITLLKFDTQAAYNVVRNCTLAYASKLIEMDGVYVTKLLHNSMSNADVYWSWDDSTGGAADLYSAGNTYGTSLIGTQAMVQVAAPGVRIANDCWETQQHTKPALDLMTGTVFADVDARFENSGGVTVGTSVEAWLRLRAKDSYTSSTNRFLRVDASGSAYVSHSQFLLPALDGTKTGIIASGACYVASSDLKNFGTGILFASAGQISGGSIRGCTTGIQLNSGSTAVVGNDILFSGVTTQIVNNSGGTATAPGSFTANLTGCTTTITGTAHYSVNNNHVLLRIPSMSGVSNTNTMTITGLPACIQTAGGYFGQAALSLDNGSEVVAMCDVTGGTMTLWRNGSSTGWTNSGTKGVRAQIVAYQLRNV